MINITQCGRGGNFYVRNITVKVPRQQQSLYNDKLVTK